MEVNQDRCQKRSNLDSNQSTNVLEDEALTTATDSESKSQLKEFSSHREKKNLRLLAYHLITMTNQSNFIELLRKSPKPLRRAVSVFLAPTVYWDSGIQENGWFRSITEMAPVDSDGNPIPWWNYSTTNFLRDRLTDDLSVFEYGSGNSTKWFASQVGSTTSVEHDQEWGEFVRPDLPQNSTLLLEPSKKAYVESISNSPSSKYDVIVVDGEWRNLCVECALKDISDDGVFILDDADREEYEPAKSKLFDANFKSIELRGMKPLVRQEATTAIFYRTENCLCI